MTLSLRYFCIIVTIACLLPPVPAWAANGAFIPLAARPGSAAPALSFPLPARPVNAAPPRSLPSSGAKAVMTREQAQQILSIFAPAP